MKQARYGGSPIKIPDIPSSLGGIFGWAKQVQQSLKHLRDRPVLVPEATRALFKAHPWKVTANGDDSVTINAGKVIYWSASEASNDPRQPVSGSYASYAGEELTIGASGTLYAVIPTANTVLTVSDAYGESGVFSVSDVLSVELSPTFTGPNLYMPIATVTLTDSIAAVGDQVLVHNPVIDLGFAYSFNQTP